MKITESEIEYFAIELLETFDYDYIYDPSITKFSKWGIKVYL